jgi:hypothetical protein
MGSDPGTLAPEDGRASVGCVAVAAGRPIGPVAAWGTSKSAASRYDGA